MRNMPAPKGHPPYNVNGEGGQPKKYSDEFIEALADEFYNWYQKKENLWMFKFFGEKKILRKYMYEFSDRSEKFRDVVESIRELQESKLFEGTANKKYYAPTTHAALAQNHGWKFSPNQTVYNINTSTMNTEVQEAVTGQVPLNEREKIE
jgi:ABC-type Fe3+/spermidine/putrescine transport system ATPase subunit